MTRLLTQSLNRLSSMRLAFVLICAGIVWFALGIALADWADYWQPLKQLSAIPFADWGPLLHENPPILFWLVSLFLVFALLGLNTLACSITSLWPIWQKRRWRHRHLWLLPIHLLTLLIFCCHAIEILWLHQPQKVQLKAGQSVQFNDHTIRLLDIDYRDNVAFIRYDHDNHTIAGRMTRRKLEHFDPRLNTAVLEVRDPNGGVVSHGDARFLAPLEWGDNKAIVTEFYVPYGQPDSALTVKLTLSHNPLAKVYFGSYLLLVLALLFHQVHLLSGFARTERLSC